MKSFRQPFNLTGQTIAIRTSGDTDATKNGLFYVYTDHLGSTQRLSTSTGSPVLESDARFLPFGKYRVTPTAGLTDRGFTGHLHNDPIGLVYMNARYYVPGVGRFASADALVPDPQNPQSFNRYGYVLNNPLRFTDPTGHRACEEDDYCAPSPKPVRPVELKYWEKQLLAIAAFAEMHGHGNAQAEAIVWVTLNRVAGTTTPEGASFSPNSNFSATSHVAGYVLSSGQYAIGQVIMEEYGLLKMGANKNFQPIEGMTVGEVVDQAYDNLNSYYEGGVDDIYKEVVIPVISDYEAGGTDPTGGSIFFGHVTPAQAVTNEAYLRNYAESLGVSSQVVFNRFPSSQVDRTGTPVNYLVVNNLIALPQVK